MKLTTGRIVLVVLAAVILVYSIFDPAGFEWMPQCVFHRLTGLECPGCGAQRMAHALLHGDIASAWRYNAFLLILIPLLAFMIWLEIYRLRYPRLYAQFYSSATIYTLSALIFGWFVVRNFVI